MINLLNSFSKIKLQICLDCKSIVIKIISILTLDKSKKTDELNLNYMNRIQEHLKYVIPNQYTHN